MQKIDNIPPPPPLPLPVNHNHNEDSNENNAKKNKFNDDIRLSFLHFSTTQVTLMYHEILFSTL